MTFNPAGQYVYVVNSDGNGSSSIDQYHFNPSDGQLNKVSKASVPKSRNKADASQIVFAPSGKFAYLLNRTSNLIYQYSVDGYGRMELLRNQTTFVPAAPVSNLIFDPSGDYAYGVELNRDLSIWNYEIEQFVVEPSGTLKKLGS